MPERWNGCSLLDLADRPGGVLVTIECSNCLSVN